jgi:hypothetical protein
MSSSEVFDLRLSHHIQNNLYSKNDTLWLHGVSPLFRSVPGSPDVWDFLPH